MPLFQLRLRQRRQWQCGALLGVLLLAGCSAGDPPAVAAPAITNVPYVPDSGSMIVRCGALFDGLSDELQHNVSVTILNGRIAAVGAPAADDLPVLDLGNQTCLPGLIDMHTHITDLTHDTADLSIFFRRSDDEQVAIGVANAGITLRAGFTSVRDVGTYIAWTDRSVRDRINNGEAIGPRMRIAGFYLTIPGGGGDLVLPDYPVEDIPARVRTGVARGAEEFRAKAQEAVNGGADHLKMIASGAVLAFGGVPGEPEMTPEEIAAVVDVGHAAGLRVTAHAHGARSIKEAILAGVDSIEHASLIDDAGIALAAEHNVVLSMDVYCGDFIATEGRAQGWPEEFLRKNEETTEAQRQGFTRAHAAGVRIVYGTDSAVYPHGDNARQFAIMVERGMTPAEALRAATSVAAEALGQERNVGALVPGRFGDLIAVNGNPLEDVSILENVHTVVKGGLLFRTPDHP